MQTMNCEIPTLAMSNYREVLWHVQQAEIKHLHPVRPRGLEHEENIQQKNMNTWDTQLN